MIETFNFWDIFCCSLETSLLRALLMHVHLLEYRYEKAYYTYLLINDPNPHQRHQQSSRKLNRTHKIILHEEWVQGEVNMHWLT